MKKLVLWILVLVTAIPAAGVAQKLRVGEPVAASFETAHPYLAPARREAELLFSQEIHDPGASYIAPHFSRMELAPGDFVVVRAPDYSRSWSYENFGKAELGRQGNGGFWGIHIRGDKAIVELWGKSGSSAFGYAIDRYGRGYDFLAQEPLRVPDSICTVDDKENAICYAATAAAQYDKGRAVVRLFIQGAFLCTGWLVGDEGHVMTNEHCITSDAQAMNTDYEFMAEGATCVEVCPQLGCDGVVEETSATLVQDDVFLDYALVLLPSNHSGTYGFMQLRETGAVVDERIWSPQHPGGRGKEFAVISTYPGDGGFAKVNTLTEPVCSGGAEPEVGYFMDTEGGSSGSPVLGWDDNLVVALHHCRGSAFCTSGDPGIDDPNRGVSIPAIIADLGPNLPNNAIGAASIFTDGFESGDTSAWSTTVP